MPVPDLQIFYPNGQVEAVLNYIWTGGKPVVWDGTVTVGSVTSSGIIADGVDTNIKATVLNFLTGGGSANPLTVAIVDTTGAQISSFGGGTQYVVGNTVSSPIGNVILWQDTGPALRAVTATKPLPVDIKSSVSIAVTGPLTDTQLRATAVPVSGTITAAQATAANLNATVVGTGTFAVQAAINQNKTIKNATGSFTSDTDIVAAVTSKRIKVVSYSFMTFGTSATTLLLKSDGTGGTEVWRVILQSVTSQVMGANLSTTVPGFLFATDAGKKLTVDTNTGDTIHYSISYFDDDAT